MRKGFTLFELLIVIAVATILAMAGASLIPQTLGRAQFTDAKNLVQRTLEEARSRAVSGVGTGPHGVYIEQHQITSFEGSSYSSAQNTSTYPLPATVSASTTLAPSLPIAIIFSRISGAPSVLATTTASTTAIRLFGTNNASATITVSPNGEITIQ